MQPDDTAYTFIDYDQDWAGVPISLTWPQLYRRVTNMARELRLTAAAGDRAMIIAPQGLEYIVAFLGALHAGVIPVPLSVPMGVSPTSGSNRYSATPRLLLFSPLPRW